VNSLVPGFPISFYGPWLYGICRLGARVDLLILLVTFIIGQSRFNILGLACVSLTPQLRAFAANSEKNPT
jgi:hypothetical protein